jgi:hypothetical protein
VRALWYFRNIHLWRKVTDDCNSRAKHSELLIEKVHEKLFFKKLIFYMSFFDNYLEFMGRVCHAGKSASLCVTDINKQRK